MLKSIRRQSLGRGFDLDLDHRWATRIVCSDEARQCAAEKPDSSPRSHALLSIPGRPGARTRSALAYVAGELRRQQVCAADER